MSGISTHVLDTSHGRPATGVGVSLELRQGPGWKRLTEAATDADGRVASLLPKGETLAAGVYRLSFATGAYFDQQGVAGFYPEATVVFEVRNATEHHHVPLLLSPFGYSTYRGS